MLLIIYVFMKFTYKYDAPSLFFGLNVIFRFRIFKEKYKIELEIVTRYFIKN